MCAFGIVGLHLFFLFHFLGRAVQHARPQFPCQGWDLHWGCGILATGPSRKFQVYFLQEEKALFLTGVCVCVCGVYELRWKWMVNTWRNVRREIKLISCHGPVPDTTESFILSHLFSKVHCEVGVSLHSHLICEEIEPQRDASKAHVSRVLWSQDKIQNKIAAHVTSSKYC